MSFGFGGDLFAVGPDRFMDTIIVDITWRKGILWFLLLVAMDSREGHQSIVAYISCLGTACTLLSVNNTWSINTALAVGSQRLVRRSWMQADAMNRLIILYC